MSVDVTKTRRTNYDCSWGGTDLGGVDKVDLSKLIKLMQKVEIGSTGVMKLDDRFVALEDGAQITIELREITRARIKAMHPWNTGTAAATIELTPPINTLMASNYAQELILHPRDITGTSEDLQFYKTVPAGPPISRDGTKDDVWLMTFWVYPDITKLPANPYGVYKTN